MDLRKLYEYFKQSQIYVESLCILVTIPFNLIINIIESEDNETWNRPFYNAS